MTSNEKRRVSPLDAHVGFWMRMVSNQVSQAFAGKVQDSGATVAEWVILRTLYGEDRNSPSAVAERVGLSRGSVSKLVDGLVRRRLVTRVESEADRRYQDLQLTPEGADLVPKLAALADANDDEYFSALSAKEREALLRLLKKILGLKSMSPVPIN